MSRLFNKSQYYTRLTSLIILFPLITLLIYGSLTHLFFFYTKKLNTKHELIRYEKILMDTQKNSLIEKVENLTRFIRYYNYKSSNKIKKEIKNIIYITADIVNNIYKSNKDKLSKKDIQVLITNALNKVHFENNIGYIFLLDMKGNVKIHPNKDIIGKNILNIRDINGKYIIKEFISVLENDKEGFVDYYWYIPNKNKKTMYYKISFVKNLDMYDWYIGAGEYLKYMTKFVSEEILDYIKQNSTFKYGHFFISNSKNEIIFHPNSNKTDDIDKFRMEGIYEDDKQIAYTSYVAEYDWYITAIKDLKEIQQNIKIQTEKTEKNIKNDIEINMILMISTWFISLLFSLYLSLIVNKKLKNYEDKLNETNNKLIFQSKQALIGELFSMIAHQWRQPINKIASIIILLRFNLSTKKLTIKEFDSKLKNIEESIEFMSETIDDFRTFYKPKDNKENIDISILINRAINFISTSINKKEINIIKNMDTIYYEIYANEFLQVMINLIKNSCDALKYKGTIKIDLFEKNNCIYIVVTDDGMGIQKEQLLKIFDPYYTTKNDSMGLGLYMCKMIIQKHLAGDITVTSEESNTQFTIKLYRQS